MTPTQVLPWQVGKIKNIFKQLLLDNCSMFANFMKISIIAG